MNARTTLFPSNRSQAVRLPKAVAFPDAVTEAAIIRNETRRIIVPSNATWDDSFESPGLDLGRRDQPVHRRREGF